MKKGFLLNSKISYLIANMGHKDMLAIGDAGLPVPFGVDKIDLAVSRGVLNFLEVFDAILSEQHIEAVILAEEIKEKSTKMHHEILSRISKIRDKDNVKIDIIYKGFQGLLQQTKGEKVFIVS
ncbi:D-ribose pyranase [Garciella nitratireducens]|uniref:D-ribose pyranase n=1 Tax=Garciella nitratireducens TaxID=218205 RepID=UPI001BD2D28F